MPITGNPLMPKYSRINLSLNFIDPKILARFVKYLLIVLLNSTIKD